MRILVALPTDVGSRRSIATFNLKIAKTGVQIWHLSLWDVAEYLGSVFVCAGAEEGVRSATSGGDAMDSNQELAARKPMTWARFKVTVYCTDPAWVNEVCTSVAGIGNARFTVTACGVAFNQVRAVAEYQARGANGDDVKRRVRDGLKAQGFGGYEVEVHKVASVEVEHGFNLDLVRGAHITPLGDDIVNDRDEPAVDATLGWAATA